MRLRLYDVNSNKVPWEERNFYHWPYLLWFTSFDRCEEMTKTNQRNTVVESIGILFLFTCSDFQNPSLATSESCKHTFGNYRKVERYFTVERLLHIEDMNQRKECEMYKIDLRMHQYGNGRGYQATHGEFFKQAASKCDSEIPTEGPVQVHEKLPCVEQIWNASMQVFHQVNHSTGPLFALFGIT